MEFVRGMNVFVTLPTGFGILSVIPYYLLRGGWSFFFFPVVLEKKIITNSYFTFFFMFICQNVGNLKGFLLVYLHRLYLITLSSYSSTGEAPHIRTKK